MEQQEKAPFWKPALTYGAIVGFVGVLVGVVFYFLGLYAESWVQWVSLLISIVVLVFVLISYRNEYLGGYASYGQIFLMAVGVAIVASIIGTIYTYLLFGVIDPDLIDKVKLAAEERIMGNPRVPESMYDDIIERMDERMTVTRMTLNALIWGTVINIIFGLIIAAFVKKERKPEQSAV